LGDLPNVDKIISGHSYFTSAPAEKLKSVREKTAESLKTASVPLNSGKVNIVFSVTMKR
jgi:hypothetical protein